MRHAIGVAIAVWLIACFAVLLLWGTTDKRKPKWDGHQYVLPCRHCGQIVADVDYERTNDKLDLHMYRAHPEVAT